jgi:hypothetical protein
MKKTVVASSVFLALMLSGAAFAEDKAKSNAELKAKLMALEGEYSKAELLTALNAERKAQEGKFHGTIGTNVEVEEWSGSRSNGDSWEGGKVKYSLANGNFRHDDLPGYDFGFYMAREFIYNGTLFSANHEDQNDITEIYVNKSYGIKNGNIGWGLKYAQESIDHRSVPGAKVFGSYQINDWLDVHGYGLYQVEMKRKEGHTLDDGSVVGRAMGNFNYWEIEPGLGFKIADNMGAWINFRYQQGTWEEKGVSHENVETETIIKPGMWYSFGKLGTALFAEIGSFENELGATGNKHKEDYVKVGASANYPLSKNWRVFGEVSYKTVDIEYDNGDTGDNTLPFGLIGVNYSF